MHTQKRIFFLGPLLWFSSVPPFPPPRRTAITKSTATFTISALSSWVSSTSARARTQTHEQKKRPWKQNSPKASNNNTQLHSSSTTTTVVSQSVSQSVSQISKSQNARPPECQIPRWWNPRNALRKNQPYKNYHRNDDERGKKKKTNRSNWSLRCTHSLTPLLWESPKIEEEGLLQSHKRRMRLAGLLRTLKGHEKKQKISNNNTLLLRGAKAKLRNFLVQDRCASATTSLFCWDQTAEDDKRKDKNTAAAGSSCRVVAGTSGARLPSSPCVAPGLTLFHMPNN